MTKKQKYISEWRPVSSLRTIEKNITSFGYTKEYIDANHLQDKKDLLTSNGITGQMCFSEPLEVKEEGGDIFYRDNYNHLHADIPDTFQTQYGIFNNHNHGEFTSWLGKEDYTGLNGKEKEIHNAFGRNDFFIEGNYCDMFDCGSYTYAISNLMHLGLGAFKITRINQSLETLTLYDNISPRIRTCLEYNGRFQNEKGYGIIASGHNHPGFSAAGELRRETLLFQISDDGTYEIKKEWPFRISSSNSIVKSGDYIFFGQNKMVTRLNIESGELMFLTNKTDEELSVLKNMYSK